MCCKLAGPILHLLNMMLDMDNWQVLDALPRGKQICETPNSRILVMCQSEKKTSGALGLKDTTSPNIIPLLRLFILFSSCFCCPCLTTLCDPRLSIIYYFIIFAFPGFCECLIPSAGT